MGRDRRTVLLERGLVTLGWAALTVLALGLVCAGAAPARADDLPGPSPFPSSTPTVSPPSQQQIQDARNALDRLQHRSKPAATTGPTALTQVAGPTAVGNGSARSRISDEGWWTIGAAVMVLLVASETTRISVRRARHRRKA